PASAIERLWRWTRRSPRIAALTGISAGLLIVIFLGGMALSLRLNFALEQAKQDRDASRRAELAGKEKLLVSLVAEAKASRFSKRVGQRFNTLKALRAGSELARELVKPPEALAELRNLAIAALALPDLRPAEAWVSEPEEPNWATTYYSDFDPQFL